MSLYDKALAVLGWPQSPQASSIQQTALPEITTNSSTWGWFFNGIAGLPAVNERTIMSVSAAYACVNLIAGAISTLPVKLYRENGRGERDEIHGDDLWWLLNEQFLPRWSAANGWEFLSQSLLFHGDGFAKLHRNGAAVVGIEPLHPLNVEVLASNDRRRLIYRATYDDGTTEAVDQDDMLHIAGFGFNGFRGVSPLRHVLGTNAGIALATQEFAGRFFANSARPDIVLTTEQVLTQEQAEDVKQRWADSYGGLQNTFKPAVLGNGVSAKPLTMSAEDAQLLSTRQFQIEEIARAFGVPPHMIGHVEKTTSWGSGVESMGKAFVRFTLRQHLNKFQAEINRKFFRNAGKRVEFDTFDLESADMKTLFESFRIAVGRAGEPGFMSTDEVRAKLNLKRTPGGATLSTGAQDAPQQTA